MPMTDPQTTKPKSTSGGALDIHDEDTTPIGSDAQLKGTAPDDRRSQPTDVNDISETTDGDGQHAIKTQVEEATDLPQKGSA
jgi:hypothetical protein